MAKRPDYDQALKDLFRQAHDGVLALIAPDLRWQGELSPELKTVKRQADLVWDVELPDGTTGILHIESQTKVEANIGERLAGYGQRLWEEYHRRFRSVVIFLRPVRTLPRPPFVIEWMGRPTAWYDYDVVPLWKLPSEPILRGSEANLWPLAVLMAEASAQTAERAARLIATAKLPRDQRSKLMGALFLLAGMRLRAGDIFSLLGRDAMLDDLLEESNIAEVLRARFGDKWAAEDREKAHAEGLAEGRAEGLRQAAIEVLGARFNALDSELVSAIERLDLAALQELLPACATETLEQVRERLGLASKGH